MIRLNRKQPLNLAREQGQLQSTSNQLKRLKSLPGERQPKIILRIFPDGMERITWVCTRSNFQFPRRVNASTVIFCLPNSSCGACLPRSPSNHNKRNACECHGVACKTNQWSHWVWAVIILTLISLPNPGYEQDHYLQDLVYWKIVTLPYKF